MKKWLSLITIAFLTFLFITNCTEEKSVEPEPPAPDTIIADNTVQADSNTFKSNLTSIDSAQIIYSSSNSFTQSLVVGGFIASNYGEGILRKVESIQTQGDQVVVKTRQAGLDEVLLKGKINFRGKLNPQDFIIEKASHDGIKLIKENGVLTISFENISFGVSDLEINTETSFDPPEFVFNAEFDWGIKSFEAGVVILNDSYLEVNTTASVSATGNYSPPWAQVSFPPGIPTGIPFVTIIPKIKIVLNGEIGIEAASINRVDANTTITGGITYESGTYDSYNTLQQQFNFNSNLLSYDSYAKLGLSIPRVGLYLAGKAGAFLELQLYGKFEVGEDNSGIYRGVYSGLEGNAGVEAEIFGFSLQYTTPLFEQEWELAKEYLTGTNTPPVASFTVDPQNGTTNTLFNFDASECSDLEDPSNILEVRWDWEGDGLWDTPYSTTKTETHQYFSQGQYNAKLQVKDSGGLTDDKTKLITINPTGSGDVVGYWKLDELSGTIVNDSSGYNNHGTAGASTIANAYCFNGRQYPLGKEFGIFVPHSSSLNIEGSGSEGSITIEAFLLLDGYDDNGSHIVHKAEHYALGLGSLGSRGYLQLFLFTTSGNWIILQSEVQIPIGSWVHVAGTWDGNSMRVYINKELKGSKSFQGPLVPSSNDLNFGFYGATHTVSCTIDEIRITNDALVSSEFVECNE